MKNNNRVLDELKQNFNRWQRESVQPGDRENWQTVPRMVLGSQTPRDLLYTPLSHPDFDYTAELVDPATNKRVPYGKEGVTVYTHLERNSQPMIRFWAGDLSYWVSEPCSCGRTYPRFPRGIYGRADDMFIVRGENVYPSAIEDVIRGIEGYSDEFRIIITREKIMDELIVQAEALPEVPQNQINTLQNELANQLKAKGLRTIVQMMALGSLERTEFKANRIIDKRDLYDRITEDQKAKPPMADK